MFFLGLLIAFLAMLAMFACSIWLLVAAFRVSVGWGLACMFIPFAFLVFLSEHWDEARQPFLLMLCSIPAYIIGFMLLIMGNQGTTNRPAFRTGRPGGIASVPYVAHQRRPLPMDAPAVIPPTKPRTEVSRGAAYFPSTSLQELPAAEYSKSDVVHSELRGTDSGTRFDESSPSNGLLVGLQVGINEASGEILNVRPLFYAQGRWWHGELHGPSGGKKIDLLADSGYAIGGLLLSTTTRIESIQAIYLRVASAKRLDAADRKDSETIGRETGTKRRIFSEGRLVVGLFGRVAEGVNALGLVAVQPTPAKSPPAIAEARPKSVPLDDAKSPESKPPAAKKPSDPAPNLKKEEAKPVEPARPEPKIEAPAVPAEPIRKWTSSGGKFSIEAKFKSFDVHDVLLEKKDGSIFRVAFDKLSKADQDFLQPRKPK